MKLLISIAAKLSDTAGLLSQSFKTLNELLSYFDVQDYSIEGQPQLENKSTETLSLVNGNKHSYFEVYRDENGYYSKVLEPNKVSYVTVDPFERVYSIHKSLDTIPAKILSMIRYSDWKYTEYHHDSVPSKVYMIYGKSYKKGNIVKSLPSYGYIRNVDITQCKNITYSGRYD
jgi:hypothetical protein